jgi:hypothetical protein
MPCQWYVRGGGEGMRRILIGQSVPPTPFGMAFGRLKLSPLVPLSIWTKETERSGKASGGSASLTLSHSTSKPLRLYSEAVFSVYIRTVHMILILLCGIKFTHVQYYTDVQFFKWYRYGISPKTIHHIWDQYSVRRRTVRTLSSYITKIMYQKQWLNALNTCVWIKYNVAEPWYCIAA